MLDKVVFERRILQIFFEKKPSMGILNGIIDGTFTKSQVKDIAILVYAEAKSTLQIKLPERIRICPMELGNSRRFWIRILSEESGGFRLTQDHASLIYPTCVELGATPAELQFAYEKACEKLEPFYKQQPSVNFTLRELCRMWVDECILANESNTLGDALKKHYDVSEEGVYYFRLHAAEDVKHSNEGLKQIVLNATTQELQNYALSVIEESLNRFPIWIH